MNLLASRPPSCHVLPDPLATSEATGDHYLFPLLGWIRGTDQIGCQDHALGAIELKIGQIVVSVWILGWFRMVPVLGGFLAGSWCVLGGILVILEVEIER